MSCKLSVFQEKREAYIVLVKEAAGDKKKIMLATENFFELGYTDFSPSVRLIESEIDRTLGKVTVGELAESMGYSVRHVSRLFSEESGVGVKEYCRIVRLRCAVKEMIECPNQNNSRYLENLNYSDQAHFQREFKYFLGMTPREFVKLIQDY